MSNRSTIKSRMAPAAIGPYSQAVLVDDTLYCSGQIAIEPETGALKAENVEEETHQVLKNLGAILQSAGMEYRDVVRCTVYLADIRDYAQVNEVYARYFNETPPSRAAVQVAALPREARVEIDCIAVKA